MKHSFVEILRKITLAFGVFDILFGIYVGWYYSGFFGKISSNAFHSIWIPVIFGTLVWLVIYFLVYLRQCIYALIIMICFYLFYLPSEIQGDWYEILNIPNWCTSKFCLITQTVLITDLFPIVAIILLAISQAKQVYQKSRKSD